MTNNEQPMWNEIDWLKDRIFWLEVFVEDLFEVLVKNFGDAIDSEDLEKIKERMDLIKQDTPKFAEPMCPECYVRMRFVRETPSAHIVDCGLCGQAWIIDKINGVGAKVSEPSSERPIKRTAKKKK